MNKLNKPLLFVLLVTGLLWLQSSIAKFQSGNFVSGLGKTLGYFASKNPYTWFKEILTNFAIPQAATVGQLVLWGELFVALSLVLISAGVLFKVKLPKQSILILKAGLILGLFLNVTFYLAAGWTGPSTSSLNLLMGAIELIAFIYLI